MGNCCGTVSDKQSVSKSVDSLSQENKLLIKRLIHCFMELKEFGVVLKLIKIQDLTHHYYNDNRKCRHKLSILEVLEEEEYQSQLLLEMKQVYNSNTVLKKVLNHILHKLGVSVFTNTVNYFIGLEEKLREDEKLTEIYRTYDKCVYEKKEFDVTVCSVNMGKRIPEEYERLIKEICETTTYIISNRKRRVSYIGSAQISLTEHKPPKDVSNPRRGSL